jgi:phospholipid transport system substrate-binding protein
MDPEPNTGGIAMVALGVMVTCMVTFGSIAVVSADLYTPPTQTPMEEVQGTISELRYILQEFKEQGRIGERRHEIEQVVRRHLNYEQMARRSLGAGWTMLTHSEQEEFVGLFVQTIRDALANRLCEYTDQEIRYLSEQRGTQFASVAAQMTGHKIPMAIDFRLMLHPAGAWLLYDAVIDGVSIVDNYRAQFAALTRELSYAGLIAHMRQRTVLVKQFEKKESCS